MFRIVAKLAEFVWRPSDAPVTANRPDEEGSNKGEVSVNEPIGKAVKTSSFGRITSVHEGYGLIDGHIYFDKAVVVGAKLPREGDQVIVTVTTNASADAGGKHSARDGLVAESVQIVTECWDDDDGVNDTRQGTSVHVQDILERPRIGQVSQVETDQFSVNDDICLTFKEVTFSSNFTTPYVGDWIALKLSDDKSGDGRVVEVSPLRTRSFKGRITSIEGDFAAVENEVYFYVQTCSGGYVPSVDDIVDGIAAENSAHGPAFEWRYISFAPLFTVENQRLQRHARLKIKNLTDLVLDKNGIVVTSPLDFGVVMVGEKNYISAFIRNGGSVNQTLINCTFADDSAHQLFLTKARLDIIDDTIETSLDAVDEQNIALVIPPEKLACVNIICEAKFVGKTRELLVFEFDGFSIGRQVFAHIKDPKQDLIKQNGAPSVNKDKFVEHTDDSLMKQYIDNVSSTAFKLPARYIKRASKVHLPVFLPRYPVPMDLLRCIDDRVLLESRLPCLTEEMSMRNYKQKLSSLLHLEEIEQGKNMTQFNMRSVNFREAGEFLVLEVPGLAEGRPSVLTGDCIVANEPNGHKDISYEGCVHEVRGQDIYLKFHEEFHRRFTDIPYDVEFFFNRTPLRRCHQAISLWQRIGKDVLFPEQSKESTYVERRHFKRHLIHNKCLNERQMKAIQCVVEGHARPAPYIIYGPPGTGKTVTLTEAVLQVFLQQNSSRILVCAPSNSAADLLCERLHDTANFTTCDLVRLNAYHRKPESLSDTVLRYSDFSTDYYVILHYRVIVTTCVSSGMLYAMGVTQGHFTHVFIDEAGQSTEPEALICLCLAAATSTDVPGRAHIRGVDANRETEAFQMILAGDPKQLGPVIMSRHASTYGLQTSLLERLSGRQLYRRDENRPEGYDPCYVTKLVENYRSHVALLQLPSQLFYDDELVAKVDSATASALCNWKYLPNREFPIVFHGMKGQDLQEMDSPSWFNAEEVFRVICYLESLYYDMKLKPNDVGIVTPYRKQVEKIRMMIDRVGLEAPKVGSVEEFQGQERSAIIVSTVRSSESWLRFDESHNLGFVFNEKRFNVTVTRAKSLLVVVGNPFVLIKDPIWRSFLRYCFTNNAYTGCEVNEIRDMLFGGQEKQS